ncbi:MAG: hypothetical protein IE917_16795 [Betaproteobacteria bacterium]|nr:hypothetical protein [Paracoccaceae bacterium]MBD3813858.1 hypothetical protein [Betaproteobacteria bacterium]
MAWGPGTLFQEREKSITSEGDDVLNRGTDDRDTEIRFQGLTIGGSYQFTPSAQLLFDYQFRRYDAPRLDSNSTTNSLLDGVDNRFGVRFIYQLGF